MSRCVSVLMQDGHIMHFVEVGSVVYTADAAFSSRNMVPGCSIDVLLASCEANGATVTEPSAEDVAARMARRSDERRAGQRQ